MSQVPAGRYPIRPTQRDLQELKESILGVATPETLDTLSEIAAALGNDPNYFTTIADQVSELNTDVTDVVAALGIAENDSDVGTFSSPTLPDSTTLRAVLEAFASAYDTTKSNLESADNTLSGRIDTLEADPTTATAVAQVQADVDQNELDSDAADLALSNRLDTLEADPTTQTVVDNLETALDGRLDVLEADPTTQTLLDAEQTARENADSALSGRLDTLEADPTTQTLLDAESTARSDADGLLSGRLDTLEADPTTATAVALKLDAADPAATGDLTVDTNARLQFDSNLTKVENVLRGTRIDIGNNITLYPAAAGGRVEVEGEFYLRPSDLTDAADDTAAAAAGIIVGQVYRNGSQLMVRVS